MTFVWKLVSSRKSSTFSILFLWIFIASSELWLCFEVSNNSRKASVDRRLPDPCFEGSEPWDSSSFRRRRLKLCEKGRRWCLGWWSPQLLCPNNSPPPRQKGETEGSRGLARPKKCCFDGRWGRADCQEDEKWQQQTRKSPKSEVQHPYHSEERRSPSKVDFPTIEASRRRPSRVQILTLRKVGAKLSGRLFPEQRCIEEDRKTDSVLRGCWRWWRKEEHFVKPRGFLEAWWWCRKYLRCRCCCCCCYWRVQGRSALFGVAWEFMIINIFITLSYFIVLSVFDVYIQERFTSICSISCSFTRVNSWTFAIKSWWWSWLRVGIDPEYSVPPLLSTWGTGFIGLLILAAVEAFSASISSLSTWYSIL